MLDKQNRQKIMVKMDKILSLIIVLLIVAVASVHGQQGDILKSEAITIEQLGEYAKAAEIYGNAAKAYEAEGKMDTLTVFKAGQCYAKGNVFDKALPLIQKCKDLKYNEPGVYLYLGITQEGLGNVIDAEASYKEGKELFPTQATDFYKKLGQMYYSQKKYKEAGVEFEGAIKSSPGDVTLLSMLATSYDNQGKYDQAAETYKKVLEVNPNHKNASIKLGLVYYKKVSALYKKEKKKYESIKNPSRVDYHNYKKRLEALNVHYKNALPYLEKAHAKAPSNKSVNSCLSITYRRLGMKEKEAEINKLLK